MILSTRSLKNLEGVHPDMVKVVKRAALITDLDFIITEGVRSMMRQSELVKAGASQSMASRHVPVGSGPGHAIDLAAVIGGEVRWDWPLYNKLAAVMKQAAKDVEVPIEWGGDWPKFKDGPHFQLPKSIYP